MKNLVTTILLFSSLLFAGNPLQLKIDSICIYPDTVDTEPQKFGYTIKAYWTLKNLSKDIIKNVNPLWYIYADNVQTSSRVKKDDEGIGCCGLGNAILKVFLNDTTYIPAFVGFIEAPGDTRKINLSQNEEFTSIIGGFFELQNISEHSYVKLEYNTLYQQAHSKPIYRCKLDSQKFMISIISNKKEEKK